MSKENDPHISNSTRVAGFLLMRFSDLWEFRVVHAMLFLLMYLAALLGNLLIVTVTTFDQRLHTPMYFFLRNLSVLDMGYISVTVPKACVIFLLDDTSISGAGCAAQVFLVPFFAFAELLFLTIMAHDRYVAICKPLTYTVIMKPQVCAQVTLASIFSGVVYSGLHTGNTFRLPFCQSNVIHQFFCDIPSLLRLSCADTFSNVIGIFISTLLIGGGCFAFIATSYVRILSTVLKCPSKERGKAFSTCVPHIIVLTVFIGSASAVYLKPTSDSSTDLDMITSLFYCIAPPLLNPVIYSLRNHQIKEAIHKTMTIAFKEVRS